ncbi:MAG: N-acetylglucosamine-6-phosphate deacetylase [Tannerella sp.]|jgi:N-acetylglucosamine-6-phosphate deacetylase|nr:N-acetylglucosamine-6-phosphate deacetylase [Tannerella sp.]
MTKRIKIINGRLLTPTRIIPGEVCLADGKICEVGGDRVDFPGAEVIDARGHYVSPGFIDLHVHGAGGADFMDGTAAAWLTVVETHAQHGTTTLFPTTVAATAEETRHTCAVYREAAAANTRGATMAGLHLEGPYFAMNQRGAQDPNHIRNPHPDEYLPLLEEASGLIARWSAAPELEGSKAFAGALTARGILPAMGHTDALFDEALEAFDWGFTHVTHFYSCTSTITRRNARRYAGVVEAAYLTPGMTVELIADGVHLPAPLLQLVYQIKGPEHIALVTDAMRAAGMPEGPSIIGSLTHGRPVIVEDGVAKLPDRSVFAGSVATTDRLVRTGISVGKFPLLQTVQMATATPARIMGIDRHKGSLARGKDADIVIFDESVNMQTVIINGNIILNKL